MISESQIYLKKQDKQKLSEHQRAIDILLMRFQDNMERFQGEKEAFRKQENIIDDELFHFYELQRQQRESVLKKPQVKRIQKDFKKLIVELLECEEVTIDVKELVEHITGEVACKYHLKKYEELNKNKDKKNS